MNHLKFMRFKKEKTQDQIFLETGIPQSKVSRIENGYLIPSVREKELLARVLDCNEEDIFPSQSHSQIATG